MSIQLMFYWVGVTKAVKKWIKACAVCQKQAPTKPSEPRVQFCLVYGCDASSYIHPDLSFHRSGATFTMFLKSFFCMWKVCSDSINKLCTLWWRGG